MMKLSFVFVACLLVVAGGGVLGQSSSGAGCSVSVSYTPRSGGSFQYGSGVSQIYDIVVTNNGRCPADKIILHLTRPASTSSVQQRWNLHDTGSGLYEVTSFAPSLGVGSTVNAGIILNYPNTQTVPANAFTATLNSVLCPSGCIASQATTTSSSGSGTTVAASTSVQTTTSTTGTITTTGSQIARCMVTATETARSGGSYQCGSGICQIYDVPVMNSGQCSVNNIILQITLPSGATIDSTFNLAANGNNRYTVTNYSGTLVHGSSVNTGFIVSFRNTQTVPASGIYTNVDVTTCNQCQQ